jgi:hypothetical protein
MQLRNRVLLEAVIPLLNRAPDFGFSDSLLYLKKQ